MEVIKKIENFFLKVENFLSKADFIARFSTAMGVGIKAFNDHLMTRNSDVLKTYLHERK